MRAQRRARTGAWSERVETAEVRYDLPMIGRFLTFRCVPLGLIPLTRPSTDVDATLVPRRPRLALRARTAKSYVSCLFRDAGTMTNRVCFDELCLHLMSLEHCVGMTIPRRTRQSHRRSRPPHLLHLPGGCERLEAACAGLSGARGTSWRRSMDGRGTRFCLPHHLTAVAAGWHSDHACLRGIRGDGLPFAS